MAEEEHCPMEDQDIIEDKQPAEAKLTDKSSFLPIVSPQRIILSLASYYTRLLVAPNRHPLFW